MRIISRKNKNGTTVQYYQLAHNERHPVTKKPVAKVIHSFGRADELDRDELVRLCKSIGRVCGLTILDPYDEEQPVPRSFGLPDNLKIIETRSMGCVMVVEALWDRLGLKKLLEGIVRKNHLRVPYERALLAMVANRLCCPDSKLGVWDRWLDTVYLPSCNHLKLRHMYEAMDLLYDHAQEIEKAVFFETANLFNLTADLVFYDTTTASFSVDWEDDDPEAPSNLRKFGHSKEGVWSPQVVVALAVTREGLPVKCWVFPGNTTDTQTVKQVRDDLRGWNLGRTMFVADAGVNSADNRKELARACGKYLMATRMASSAEIKQDVLSKKGALLIERIAELECNKSWHKIRHVLGKLQATKFFNLNHSFHCRNEPTQEVRNILKDLKISLPKSVFDIEKQPEKS